MFRSLKLTKTPTSAYKHISNYFGEVSIINPDQEKKKYKKYLKKIQADQEKRLWGLVALIFHLNQSA